MTNWISVKDRLPESEGEYVVRDSEGDILITDFHIRPDGGIWDNDIWQIVFLISIHR